MLNWGGTFYSGDRADLQRLLEIDDCLKEIYSRRVCKYREWARSFGGKLTPIEPGASPIRVFTDGEACGKLANTIRLTGKHLRTQARRQQAGTTPEGKWGPGITLDTVCNLIAMNMLAGEPVRVPEESCDAQKEWCDE